MIKLACPQPEFHLVGVVNKFVLGKKGKIKSFELKTEKETYKFKIPHKLHKKFHYQLYPETKLEVIGKVDICLKTARIKLKPEKLTIITPNSPTSKIKIEDLTQSLANPLGKILICQKSTCWKNGGARIYEKITEELKSLGLDNQIMIKKTGCMGRCKSAPNLVVLPDKQKYSCVSECEISDLINTHFC
jgi:(2Fe-2S) ferredoxin